MTNADKIRQMSDEELMEWLINHECKCGYDRAHCNNYVSCYACWKGWLAEEADEIENKKEDGK